MQLLDGMSLDERLRREGALGAEEVIRITREIAEGLAAAHAEGLIHRDIKPANIWLEKRPARDGEPPGTRVKILDFGLARVARADALLTQAGAIVGTPAFMAPEQARGEMLDGRCDLFSLGCVMYRMTTGRLPFHAPDAMATLLAVASASPPSPQRCESRRARRAFRLDYAMPVEKSRGTAGVRPRLDREAAIHFRGIDGGPIGDASRTPGNSIPNPDESGGRLCANRYVGGRRLRGVPAGSFPG